MQEIGNKNTHVFSLKSLGIVVNKVLDALHLVHITFTRTSCYALSLNKLDAMSVQRPVYVRNEYERDEICHNFPERVSI